MKEDSKRKIGVARRTDWKTEPMPEQCETFVLHRRFRDEEMIALRRGNIPQSMEDKWFWYMEGSTLWAHRSWTGNCIYRIDFKEDNDHIVTVNRDPEQYRCTSIAEDIEALNNLLNWWTEVPYDHYTEWLSETYDMLKSADGQSKLPAVIETERLILRPWEEADAEECYKYAKDPRVGPMAGWPVHTGVENSRRIIRDVLIAPEIYAIVLKETGLPVGSIGLHHNELAEKEDEAELGYWLGVPYWGRGIVPEAARAVLRHAFEDLGLDRVWCCYFDGNERSKRVQEKLGFRYQRTIEHAPVPQLGETRKNHVNLMTKAEWQNINRGSENQGRQ